MARPVSKPDQALSDELMLRDLDVKPRQIESMRQAGMLDTGVRQGLGRGRGSRSLRAAEEADRAEYMARLLAECGSYADALLVANVRGRHPITQGRLEQAYEESFRAITRWVEKRAGPATSALDRAAQAGSKIARALQKQRVFRPVRERVRHLGLVHRVAPMHRVLQDLGTDVIALVIGGARDSPLTDQAARNMEKLVGDGMIGDTEPVEPERDGASFAELFQRFNFEGAVYLVRTASMDELECGRRSVIAFRAFAGVYGPFAARAAGSPQAFAWILIGQASDRVVAWAIPAFVLLHRLRGTELERLIGFMEAWTPLFTAVNIVLDQLPDELQVLARDGGYDSLTNTQREQLADHFQRLEITHRAEMNVLKNPPKMPEIPG